MFNKPNLNEQEVMRVQRRKASFNSKFAKFEGRDILTKRNSLPKQKIEMFETHEVDLGKENEAKLRKENFVKMRKVFVLEGSTLGAIEEHSECVLAGEKIKKKFIAEQDENTEDAEDEEIEAQVKDDNITES